MADTAELKHMIISFRNAELQNLLNFAGATKTGRRQELLTRALSLLKDPNPRIQHKIQELYRATVGICPPITANKTAAELSQLALARQALRAASAAETLQISRRDYSSANQARLVYSSGAAQSTRPPDYAPSLSIVGVRSLSAKTAPSPAPRPDAYAGSTLVSVTLESLPFYDLLGSLLSPTLLHSVRPPRIVDKKKQMSDTFFSFSVSDDLSRNYPYCPMSKLPVQVVMRFCQLDPTATQKDNFPASIGVRINGKMAPLPNPIPSNRPGVEPKRPSRPVDISSLCRFNNGTNRVDVEWSADPTGAKRHCIAIDLLRRLNADILIMRLRNRRVVDPEKTRRMIVEKMRSDDGDDDIAPCDLRVSLQCPVMKTRIQLPCRPTSCSHVQCFDAINFLKMNERKPTWVCPVCDKYAHFDNLAVDGYFVNLLSAVSAETTEVCFNEKGDWISAGKQKGGDSTTRREKRVEEPARAPTPKEAVEKATPSADGAVKRTIVAVDLTLSDSEDEDAAPPPAKRASIASQPATTAYPDSNPTPVSLTANQSVQQFQAPLGTADAFSTATPPTPPTGLFGMSPYGLPPPPSELMDLRNPANMALLDFIPGNPTPNDSPNSGSNSHSPRNHSYSTNVSTHREIIDDVVTLD